MDQIRCLKPAVCITSEISALSNFEYVCLKCHIKEEGEPNAYFFQMGEVSRRRKISERDSANVDTSIKKPTRVARDNTEFFFIHMPFCSARAISTYLCNWPIHLFSAKLYTVQNQIFHSCSPNGGAFISPWQQA